MKTLAFAIIMACHDSLEDIPSKVCQCYMYLSLEVSVNVCKKHICSYIDSEVQSNTIHSVHKPFDQQNAKWKVSKGDWIPELFSQNLEIFSYI